MCCTVSAAFFALAFIVSTAYSCTTSHFGQGNHICHSKTVAATSAADSCQNSALQCCAKVLLQTCDLCEEDYWHEPPLG